MCWPTPGLTPSCGELESQRFEYQLQGPHRSAILGGLHLPLLESGDPDRASLLGGCVGGRV